MLRPTVLFLMIALSLRAFAGGVSVIGGGGDPDVVQFMRLLEVLPRILLANEKAASALTAQEANAVFNAIAATLKTNDTTDDLISFEEEPLDIGGVKKPAWYRLDTRRIHVHRATWNSYANQQYKQLAIVYLETMLAAKKMDINRYERAGNAVFAADSAASLAVETLLWRKSQTSFEVCDSSSKLEGPTGAFDRSYRSVRLRTTWFAPDTEFDFTHDLQQVPEKEDQKFHQLFRLQLRHEKPTMTSWKTSDWSRRFYFFTVEGGGIMDPLDDGAESSTEFRRADGGRIEAHAGTVNLPLQFDGNTMVRTTLRKGVNLNETTRIVSGQVICRETVVSQEWLRLIPEASVIDELRAFDRTMRELATWELATAKCESADCAELKTTYSEKLAKAERDWRGLFAARRAFAPAQLVLSREALAKRVDAFLATTTDERLKAQGAGILSELREGF